MKTKIHKKFRKDKKPFSRRQSCAISDNFTLEFPVSVNVMPKNMLHQLPDSNEKRFRRAYN